MLSKGEATKLIEGEAERREHKLGWRLLMSPWSTLSSARSAIITMNPGTPRDSAKRPSVIEWEVPRLSVEQGSAYPAGELVEHAAGHGSPPAAALAFH